MAEHPRQAVGAVEFTYRWYRDFLHEVRSRGYTPTAFSGQVRAGDVVIRHDVDLSLEAALRMARLEADMGVEATYCILLSSPLYNPFERIERERIRTIESLGHEIALHFSTHEYWAPDDPPIEAAIERRVREERSVVESLSSEPSTTVSFHIPPEWVVDRAFDGFENTYAPAYFGDDRYVADSGQRWREEPPDPADLPDTFQLLTHPGLWGEEDATFEERIERKVVDACRHSNRRARREIVEGVTW